MRILRSARPDGTEVRTLYGGQQNFNRRAKKPPESGAKRADGLELVRRPLPGAFEARDARNEPALI